MHVDLVNLDDGEAASQREEDCKIDIAASVPCDIDEALLANSDLYDSQL